MSTIMEHSNAKRPNRSEKVGEISRIFQRGSQWYVTLQYQNRQRRVSLHTESKKQAVLEALRIEREFLSGRRNETERAVKLDEAIELFMASKRALARAERTLKKYEYCFTLAKQLAAKRRITKLSQVDIRFMDAYQAMRLDLAAEDSNPAKSVSSNCLIG